MTIRKDFGASSNSNRSKTVEVLEGTFLKAREQYEEKKLSYLGYFYAYVAFHAEFEMNRANFLLNVFEKLTYEEFCLLKAISEKEKHHFLNKKLPYHIDIVLWSEVADLIQNGLVSQQNLLVEPSGIVPAQLSLNDYGKNFIEYFAISKVPEHDLAGILEKLEYDV